MTVVFMPPFRRKETILLFLCEMAELGDMRNEKDKSCKF
jgi:hypothetical protein